MSGTEFLFFVVIVVILIFIAALFAAMPIVKYVTSTWLAKLQTGGIGYIYRNDSHVGTITDVPGKKLKGKKLVPLEVGECPEKTWLNKLGLYWVGISIPHVSTVGLRKFKVQRRKEEEVTTGKEPDNWIKDMGSIIVDFLLAIIPRPFLLREVEIGDRQTLNLLVATKLVVVDTDKPVPELNGDFFELAASFLKAGVGDVLKNIPSMDKFIESNKREGGILACLENNPETGEVSEFNKGFEKLVGLHLVGAAISEWDPSDKKVREAMTLKFITEKQREAEIIAAEAYAQQIGIRNKADVEAQTNLAKAHGERVRQTLQALVTQGAHGETMVKAAAQILQAASWPGLTQHVSLGNETQVTFPVGGVK
jgi:hypothetical protein